ncbi:tektin-3-like [Prorops nasuta]|uniref:tektin-3-like n=1 Tax=Prorops nasuta TaxID=863751 RepID=UPI0034CEF191
MCDTIVQQTRQSCNPLFSKQNQTWNNIFAARCSAEKRENAAVIKKDPHFVKTRKSSPWRPIHSNEAIEYLSEFFELQYSLSRPSIPVTNQVADACFVPNGMITEPLRFPNLVTGFERNPSHAARAALSMRYTNEDWKQNQILLYNEADSNRNYSESLRANTAALLREGDKIAEEGQIETGRRINERIKDFTDWKNKVSSELEKMIKEINYMESCKRGFLLALHNLEGPLHIAQECISHREFRQGIDLVHDDPEKALLREVQTIRRCEKKIKCMMDKINNQLANNRAVQNELELDERKKEITLDIDTMCHQLNNFSHGLMTFAGLKDYDLVVKPETLDERADSEERSLLDNDFGYILYNTRVFLQYIIKLLFLIGARLIRLIDYSDGFDEKNLFFYQLSANDIATWTAAANAMVNKSKEEREKSEKFRKSAETFMNTIGNDIWDAWMTTNNALIKKISEMIEGKESLQIHLQKTQREIFNVEKNLEIVRKSITDKTKYLQVAQTRMEARINRPASESCNDPAQLKIVDEVESIQKVLDDLNEKMIKFEAEKQHILHTRANLEVDLKSKVDTIFIDREKCLGLRRSYPISSHIVLKS